MVTDFMTEEPGVSGWVPVKVILPENPSSPRVDCISGFCVFASVKPSMEVISLLQFSSLKLTRWSAEESTALVGESWLSSDRTILPAPNSSSSCRLISSTRSFMVQSVLSAVTSLFTMISTSFPSTFKEKIWGVPPFIPPRTASLRSALISSADTRFPLLFTPSRLPVTESPLFTPNIAVSRFPAVCSRLILEISPVVLDSIINLSSMEE